MWFPCGSVPRLNDFHVLSVSNCAVRQQLKRPVVTISPLRPYRHQTTVSNVKCHKERERLHGEFAHKTILVQKLEFLLARLAGWSSLRSLKILGNWHLVTLSSDPLTNLNCFMRYVFRRKRFNFLPPWNWVGLGELLLFSYFDRRSRRPVCAQVSSKLFLRLCWAQI